MSSIVHDEPAIFVVDEVIALMVSIQEMQEIADTCCKCKNSKGLNWNAIKSKLLSMILELETPQQTTVEVE